MRNELTLAGVFIVLGMSAASAQVSTDAAVKLLADQGFTNIQVDRDRGDNELSIEGWRGEEKVEITYDTRTGSVVNRETETVRGGRAAEIADDRDDDDGSDDNGGDRGDGGSDDNGGSSDDDGGSDDNGGDRGDGGSDDNGGSSDDDGGSDDNGGGSDDDGGSDDNGGDDD